MEVAARLTDLSIMHPRLSWGDIALAAVAVLRRSGGTSPFSFELAVENVPNYATGIVTLAMDADGLPLQRIARLLRTFESSRLVEMAAIAVAALGVYYAGGHEIRDVALRGTGADYLVGESNHLLEIAGRSRRSDLGAAWDQRWQRLTTRLESGFYLCVVEFETPSGRLEFRG